MILKPTLLLCTALLSLAPAGLSAQCDPGLLEVTIQVITDNFGNETLWQLVPNGNACDEAPIFTGGNPAIDCGDAGGGTSPNGGYANNVTINEGPFCLAEGSSFDIISIDSYGDGQASFNVLVEGGFAGLFEGDGGINVYTFIVTPPLARDLALVDNTTGFFCEVGTPVIVAGKVQNVGGQAISGFEIGYTIGESAEQFATFTAALTPGATYHFEHAISWTPASQGANDLVMRISGVNGGTDLNAANDEATSVLTVNPAIPDRTAEYLALPPVLTVVADGDNDILVPRDLDFHPDRNRNELWVINKDVFNTGASTVKFTNPGEADQEFLYQRDPAARHFMSLPTGIAMADNGNFSTSPGVYDANGNQSTTTPFTGPTLWSADPEIYAQTGFGPLGSHLDMLHVTPQSQGIAHERWNKFWVVDGFNQDVVMHDFREDHGPGNDFHGNAIIHRFPQLEITRDPGNHIVSHCVVDKKTGWLYVVDHGGQRVMRLDTRSGTPQATPPSFGPFEGYVEYKVMTNATWEVIVDGGLQQPAGIDVVGERLLVSDHATGEIIIYDLANSFAELGRIEATPGIMGIKVGPDGRIWYVNATNSTLVRVDPNLNVAVNTTRMEELRLAPSPASETIFLTRALEINAAVRIMDAAGRICLNSTTNALTQGLDVSTLAEGAYTALVNGFKPQRFVIAR